MTVICALDLETDGLHPTRQAWEVALIRRDEQGQREEHFFLPIDLSTSDPAGLRIGGFYTRHPEGIRLANPVGVKTAGTTKDLKSAARVIARATHGATIIGATPNFDTEVLERLLRSQQLAPAWSHRLRCVTTLTAGHLHRDVGGLAACAEALGIAFPTAEQHTALGDAKVSLAIYDAVMGVPGQVGVGT